MFERFTERAVRVIIAAQDEARRHNKNSVGTEELLLGLIIEGEGVAFRVLDSHGVTKKVVRRMITEIVGRSWDVCDPEIPFSSRAKNVLEVSVAEGILLGHNYVGTEHLLLALIKEQDSYARAILRRLAIDLRDLQIDILTELSDTAECLDALYELQQEKEARYSTSETEEEITDSLREYTQNLTGKIKNGDYDPLIGRDDEIKRVVQTLTRRGKNNPVLIGFPGVGKTAVAEGLAKCIIDGDVPPRLDGKVIVSLQLGILLSGTKYRGEFEERLRTIIDDVKRQKLILVIDEIHTLVGAGAAEGAVDAANILKPQLARGELQIVGATTIDEYRKYIEKDPALERRFHPIMIDEPTITDAIQILRGLCKKFEQFHELEFTNDAIEACVTLSARYIGDRYLPDKAIDIMDETAANVIMNRQHLPDAAVGIEKDLRQVITSKNEAVKSQDYPQAAELLRQEQELRAQLNVIINTHKRLPPTTKHDLTVTEDDVARVVSEWTKVPVTKVDGIEAEKLKNLEDAIHKRIIGQHDAVVSVANAIRRARSGLRNLNRPIANLVFAGPTGVGKTELTKALAAALFDNDDNLIRLDMSEFMEKHTTAKLIGSPPGYVGYNEGGQLTEAVRRNPYSVVLFDEIEKGHIDVFNLLLQILEDGRLTDSKGRLVDFKNTLIIMTSNIGATQIQELTKEFNKEHLRTIGGKTELYCSDAEKEKFQESLLEAVKKAAENYFRPEIMNRIDEVIVFNQLTKNEIRQIADIMCDQVIERVKSSYNIKLHITDNLKDFLTEQGYDPIYGARPLRRAITRYLENTIAEAIVEDRFKSEDSIYIDGTSLDTIKLDFNKEDIEKNSDKSIELTNREKWWLGIHPEGLTLFDDEPTLERWQLARERAGILRWTPEQVQMLKQIRLDFWSEMESWIVDSRLRIRERNRLDEEHESMVSARDKLQKLGQEIKSEKDQHGYDSEN